MEIRHKIYVAFYKCRNKCQADILTSARDNSLTYIYTYLLENNVYMGSALEKLKFHFRLKEKNSLKIVIDSQIKSYAMGH